ncbi:nucleoside deaminase [Staphylococcus equorum]|uniref:nucleoside deaminase n=1 Tax=Staphylococcus equorum TaxID=246432 RepID=UPI0025556512|nr:nucleoside deaminase [Staphylococcus equorum]MDK9852429.1 nucleoside deaminase [Staphylococcus equorum]MDK9858036.1 nucleoside deaminase [Staphylococcus equorum]MDK9875096.1 nucleoside deaminase [Staphylococcus equorum]
MLSESDITYLKRCVELAEQALNKGDEPFRSILVSSNDNILFKDHNHVSGGDHTRHPEFEIARWAANHLSPEERKTVTVYTFGKHCSMCADAHGWVVLGRIVYASSSEQLNTWLSDISAPQSPVKSLPIYQVIENTDVDGPVEELAEKVHTLYLKLHIE